MKLGLKEKELKLSQNILDINHINIKKNDSLLRNNDQSSTKEDENIIYDEPIEYCSSPKIGLVSIHGSRNKNNLILKFTENKTDIPNTVSMYVNPIKTEIGLDNNNKSNNSNNNSNNNSINNSNIKDKDDNFFLQKRRQTHKIEKYKEKKSIIINKDTTNMMKKPNKSEKYNSLNLKFLEKKIEKKKKILKKVENEKNEKNEKIVRKKEKQLRDKTKQFKRKSTSYSISALSEKMNKIKNKLTQNQGIKEKSKEENKDSDLDKYQPKEKKEETSKNDMTPNIIIYGSESSDNNNEESNIGDNSNKNKNEDDFLKSKNYSNLSISNTNNLDKTETKILKPRSKQSGSIIYTGIKKMKAKKNRMQRKFTSGNVSGKIKLNHKYSSANDYEKHKEKDKKKISLLKLLTTKNLFKDDKDKDSNKFKPRNSVSKHILSIQQYNQFSLKKNSLHSSKDAKDTKDGSKLNSIKPSSDLSLKVTKVEEEPPKKSNKNLRHNELDKSFVKKCSFNSNMNIPRLTIKTQENDPNEIHLVVKGKEETIINYTNQQMIKDEKEYMIQCLKVLAKLEKEKMPRCKQKVNFNFPQEEKQKKIALFDLDETLVHCNNNKPGMNGDEVSVKLPTNKIVKVGLNIRNNWKKALDLIKNHYHIVIYTASHPSYADAVLDYLDKENKYFKYRLYRNHCIQCDVDGFKFYVKDLDTLDENYNLKDIVIIDNSILSFAYHLYNGVPIVPFIDQANDSELMYTAHYLVSIASYDDLSLENKKHLNLDDLLTMAKMLNEVDDNEEEEEEDETNDKNTASLIKIEKMEQTGDVKPKISRTQKLDKNSILSLKIPELKNDPQNNNDGKDESHRGRQSLSRSRKTIKIQADMRKNLDEMLKKKKEELEIINED